MSHPEEHTAEPQDATLPAGAPAAGTRSGVSPAPATRGGPSPDLPPGASERRAAAAARRALDRHVTTVMEGMSDAFIALGPDWRVTFANREAARLGGTTPEALVGKSQWEQWPETAGSEVERQYRRAAAEHVPVLFEHHYAGADVWHEIRAYPSDDGGIDVFYRDVTAPKRLAAERARQARESGDAHDRARAAETPFRLLVEGVRDYAVVVLDQDGIITHWGSGAGRMNGYTSEEAVGRPLSMLYPEGDGGAEDGTAVEHLRHAATQGEYVGEGTRRRKGGERFPARVVLTALRRRGRLVGFSNITQDLTADREREKTLARAAEAASVAKSQFLANTSHELRTPLNAVIGYTELLELGLAGEMSPLQRRYVARIQSTGRHLLSLVNDVLDLSKTEAGQMRTARDAALVSDAVSAALHIVDPQAGARGVTVANGCTASAGAAYRGDIERVRQIVVNLLANAVRFTEKGGRVTVTCGTADRAPADAEVAAEGRHAYVRIEDTGVGIAPEQLERVWEAFVQVDGNRTRRFGGTGLGLAISRDLARLMGGDITAKSSPGLGSQFVLWLPAADAADAEREERDGAGAEGAEAAAARAGAQDPQQVLLDLRGSEEEGLREIGDALLTEIERVVAMYVARLRADPETPSAHDLDDAQAEDHCVTFLADVAQCLTAVALGGPDAAEALRDGSTIQLLIARRHGLQRARLGWAEAELRREYRVLRDEVYAAAVRRVARGAELRRALGIVNHYFAVAERESVAGFAEGGG